MRPVAESGDRLLSGRRVTNTRIQQSAQRVRREDVLPIPIFDGAVTAQAKTAAGAGINPRRLRCQATVRITRFIARLEVGFHVRVRDFENRLGGVSASGSGDHHGATLLSLRVAGPEIRDVADAVGQHNPQLRQRETPRMDFRVRIGFRHLCEPPVRARKAPDRG